VAKRTTKKPAVLSLAAVRRELAEIGRVGQAFVDGDLVHEAYFPHSRTFMCGDDMDFNPAAFLPLKMTMLRLERLSRVKCSTTLWRRRPDMPDRGEALIYGSYSSPHGGDKPAARGYQPKPMFPELARAFLRGLPAWKVTRDWRAGSMSERGMGVRIAGVKQPTFVEHFVPVKDSMGEIAAVLEVFAATDGK